MMVALAAFDADGAAYDSGYEDDAYDVNDDDSNDGKNKANDVMWRWLFFY